MSHPDEPHGDPDEALGAASRERLAPEGAPRRGWRPRMLSISAGLVVAVIVVAVIAVATTRAGPDDSLASAPAVTSATDSTQPSDSAQPSESAPPPPLAEPPAVGTWQLSNPEEVNADSTTIQLDVTRLQCAGGDTGTVLPPEVIYEADRVLIRTPVVALPQGYYTCQGNNSVPLTVQLREPVGARQLMDVACLDGEAVGTSLCMDGPARWSP